MNNIRNMVNLMDLVAYCDDRTQLHEVKDFPGAFNGLQIENNGKVSKIGAAVDAGLFPFEKATDCNVDFLIVHHGLFWNSPFPLVGSNHTKIKHCINHNLAVYSSHLPLDCHSEIGNNAILANKLELEKLTGFLNYEGNNIGLLTSCNFDRDELKSRLQNLFPKGFQSIEFGSSEPQRIAILTGSGQSAVDQILESGCDTLITGELKQQHYNYAQENKLNLYLCGHYATEVFGVNELGMELASHFDLPYEFVSTNCPL